MVYASKKIPKYVRIWAVFNASIRKKRRFLGQHCLANLDLCAGNFFCNRKQTKNVNFFVMIKKKINVIKTFDFLIVLW